MDKYAIGRLFRKFDDIKMDNIIFYVGDAHREIYSKLFNYFLKHNKDIVKKSDLDKFKNLTNRKAIAITKKTKQIKTRSRIG